MSEKMKGRFCPLNCNVWEYATDGHYCKKYAINLKCKIVCKYGIKIYRCPECLKKEKSQ